MGFDPVTSGIEAGGQVAGAAIGSYGGKKAAQAQERSNKAALDYTKQKDAQTRADAMYREGLWQTQYNDWNNQRNALLERYGFGGSFAPLSGYGATPMGSATASRGQAVPRAAQGRPSPYGDMVPTAPEENADGYANTAWNDWRRYGLE